MPLSALPDARTLLNDLRTHGTTMRINPHRNTLHLTGTPPTPDLRHRLTATKLAWLAAARGHCAWCHHEPAWIHDADTGWPTCHPCAAHLGRQRLRAEHPDQPHFWQPDQT